ncbi:MAG TPA: hypothetical protein VGM88_33210 [Kofleriaceae bacterium]|jgi:hypothetical protein
MRASIIALLGLLGCGFHSGNGSSDATGSGHDAGGDGVADTSADACGDCADVHTFAAGSLIIPMDLSYQATGTFQAYGLVYALLAHGVHVYWVIDPQKTYHADACNSPASPCAWDCELDGSGVKCAYPTASPDFVATTNVLWSDAASVVPGTPLGGAHPYRGGPFVIDAADHDAALAVVNAWNDSSMWSANPWAARSVFHVVSVHEATASFQGTLARRMYRPPTIAVFSDGNEQIATGYLRAAGIPQSNGSEFPMNNCTTGACGPGTANPDLLDETAIMGDLGTCSAPNTNHHNGALFKSDGTPAYCQIMSMHWDVTDRERVTCAGGQCPRSAAECTGQAYTYNGHEVVAEVREFLGYGTHFFAECQAVNAYENTSPNPDYPYLDDPGRDGHFLTTAGTPPACSQTNPCTDSNYQCVTGGCNGTDCCLPQPQTWVDLPGYEVAAQPATAKVLHPEVPYNQFDGAFGTTGGSEPAYNLSTYLGTMYKNNRQVTLLTGPDGPGDQDLWMTGYLDGCNDIVVGRDAPGPAQCLGKISYLGGHQYSTTVPVQSGSTSIGTRLFLNALFEADCVTMP